MVYDAIIIGAGQAGLMAARELKNAGANFICIDQKERIGEPLRCGESIRKRDFEEVFGRIRYPFVLNEVTEHRIVYGIKEKVLHEPCLEIDKPEFERWLAKPVMKNIKLKTACKIISIKDGFAEAVTSRGIIRAKIVIIATGPSYNLLEGLGAMKRKMNVVPVLGGIYSGFKGDEKSSLFFFDDKSLGYMWVFPKGKGLVNVGYGGVAQDIKEAFKSIKARYGFSSLKLQKEFGGLAPSAWLVVKTYGNRFLVAGASGGLVHIGIGEGNYYALTSGRLSGKVATEALREDNFSESFLKAYENAWKKTFMKRLEGGVKFLKILYFATKAGAFGVVLDTLPSDKLRDIMLGDAPRKARITAYFMREIYTSSPKARSNPLRFKLVISVYKLAVKAGLL